MDELSCKTIRPSLWDYAAKGLAQPEHQAIDSHLDTCRDCDRYLADISSMRIGFRHLPVQVVPPLVNTKLLVIASRERSRQLLRLNPAAWLHDMLDRALLSFDRFLRPYAVPATGGLLASCFCFSLIAHTLELRPYLGEADMPFGLYTEMTIDNVSPFSFSGKDITVQVTVDANGAVTNYATPGTTPTNEELEELGGWLLYSTFTPAMRSGQPVASKRLFAVKHMNYQIDGRESRIRTKLGQHFLISTRILDRIADAACPAGTQQVIEIGPGRGALTEKLLARAGRVIALEMDPELVVHLTERWPEGASLKVYEGNALHFDWTQWGAGVLAGNLPYYVATALISKYLANPGALAQAVFLIQKEVAERITAKPGTRDFGYLSVECQHMAKAEYLFSVQPGAFRPPPKVDSAVIRLTPRPDAAGPETEAFLSFASACFRQKRKTLRNNLASCYAKETLDAHPAVSKRAEQLSVTELLELFRALQSAASSPR